MVFGLEYGLRQKEYPRSEPDKKTSLAIYELDLKNKELKLLGKKGYERETIGDHWTIYPEDSE